MIPVLYEDNETNFTTNGIGRLTDAIECTVSEELNGPYELDMRYPLTGIHYDDIREGRIILAEPFEGGTWQPFIIYNVSRPISGIVTVKAEHISYLLNKIVIMPFTASSCAQALTAIPNHTANTCPFTFATTKTVEGDFFVAYPRAARGLLGGEQGSILDVYGKGEYEFNRFTVNLYVNRGTDNGVTIRYGKNLTDLVRDSDIENAYTGIVPFWRNHDGDLVTLTSPVVWSDYRGSFAYDIIKPVDFTSTWQEEPTQAQLQAAAEAYVTANEGWKMKENIKISFVALWQTEEYKNIANVERVKMGDTVHVIYEALGVDVAAEVIKTEYDVLTERYNSVELGAKKNSLGTVLKDTLTPAILSESNDFTSAAIEEATKLITGANGGHVVIGTNANGEPNEIYIMDTDDVGTAQKVLRMNMNGIGFSTNGFDGPYSTAWTIDGAFVADYITTGTLNANVIRAGILQAVNGGNYWNLSTGEFVLTSNTVVGNSTIASIADVDGAKTYADTVAGSAEAAAKTYADTVANEAKAIANAKITTYYQASAPTAASTGDLWIDIDDGNALYRYDGTTWVSVDNADIQQALTDAADAQSTADSKIVTFAQAAAPSATGVGDLWIDTDDDNKMYRWSGSAWISCRDGQIAIGDAATLASAESYADNAVTTYDTTVMTQTGVFNKLTVNGTKQGIYMDSNGDLYVNASYIKSGTLSLGGANNVNGTMIVYDASGNEIGHWDNSGIYILNGEIYQEQYVDSSVGTGWLRIQSTEITGGYTALNHTAIVDLQNWEWVTDTSTGQQTKEGVLSLRCTNGSIVLNPDNSIYLQAPKEINILSEAGVAVAYANLTTGAVNVAVAVAPQGVAFVTNSDSGLIVSNQNTGYVGSTKRGTRFADRGDGVQRWCDIINGILCNVAP